MLTPRGYFLLLLGIAGTGTGVLRAQQLPALVSLSVLVWIFLEWVLFRWRTEHQLRGLTCERSMHSSSASAGRLWVQRSFRMTVKITPRHSTRIPWLQCEDLLPENLECSDGGNIFNGSLHGNRSLTFQYDVTPLGAGSVVLPGITIRYTDLQGLFFAQRFLPARQSFRVRPTCLVLETGRPTVKQANTLPPPGIHRIQRAGLGSELLELREYLPGDPPKSIAWKVSARRGTLMTRRYESEVPVRTTLFVDASVGTRLGSYGQRPIDRLILLAASIARSTMSQRDPVGLVCFDNAGTKIMAAGLGDRHFYRILHIL